MNALEEEGFKIAHAATQYDEKGKITEEKVEVRLKGEPKLVTPDQVDLIDVSTNQAFSVATNMIPFLNHDDANRALMGSNMQKQATPCILPEAPLVATGIEKMGRSGYWPSYCCSRRRNNCLLLMLRKLYSNQLREKILNIDWLNSQEQTNLLLTIRDPG